MSENSTSSPLAYIVPGTISFLIYRTLNNWGAEPVFLYMFGGTALFCFLAVAIGLTNSLRLWRLILLLRRPTGLHGRTSFPSVVDGGFEGLALSNEDGNGIPLGAIYGKYIYWHGKGHASFRAPTEGGKTESLALTLLFALGKHRNIIVTAKGAELAWMSIRHRRDTLGQNVICINPWKLLTDKGLPSDDFNPIGHLPHLADTNSSELIDKAREVASILIPDPEGGSGENRIFRSQARDILTWVIVYLAILEAETGELCCNLAYIYRKLCDDPNLVMEFFHEMACCPNYEGTVQLAGNRFAGKMKRVAKSAESFLTECQDALQIYDPASPLGKFTEYSSFDPKDLKTPNKPTTIYIIIPPEKMITHGSFAGLCLNTLLMTAIEADRFEPRLTVLADEYEMLSINGPLPAIIPTLKIGRSRGVQLLTLVQETEGYKTIHGDQASAFTTQSEIVMAWGIRSNDDAEVYSKRAGQKSVKTESGSVPMMGNDAAKHSLTIDEKGLPIFRPDEYLQLAPFKAVLFHKQNPMQIIDLVSYRMVDPWREQADAMPGSPPQTHVPVKFKA